MKQFLTISHSDDGILSIIAATGDGIMWANTYAESKGVKLVCPPGKLAINRTMMRDIVENYVDDNPDEGKWGLFGLGHIVTKALVHTFPC